MKKSLTLTRWEKKLKDTAQKWLNAGYTPEQVAEGIWNKMGAFAQAKDDKVIITGYAGTGQRKPYTIAEVQKEN